MIIEDTLKTADRLQLVQQCGAGLELVDINAARERGIPVANVPSDISGNADSVAELVIYFMIGLSRNVEMMKDSLEKRIMGGPMGIALKGRTVGIVGLGGIGKALINRLRPFGVNLIGIKRSNPVQAQKDLCMEWVGGPDSLDILLNTI